MQSKAEVPGAIPTLSPSFPGPVFMRGFIVLYFLLLPFLKFGIPVGSFRIVPADFAFVLAFLISLPGLISDIASRRPVLDRSFFWFGACWAVLFAAAVLSLVVNRADFTCWLNLLPLIYSGGLIVLFGKGLTSGAPGLDRWLRHGLAFSIMAISVSSSLPQSLFPGWHDIVFKFGKFVFFTSNPNQISIMVLVFFSLLTFLRSDRSGIVPVYDAVLPALFLNIVLWSGSRIAFFSAGLILAAYYLIVLPDVFTRDRASKIRNSVRMLISICLIVLVFFYHFGIVKDQTSFRSVSGLYSVLARAAHLPADKLETGFNAHESMNAAVGIRKELNGLAVSCFLSHPLTGIGLGMFNGNYHHFEVHNTILGVAAETGLAGLAGLALIAGYLIYILTIAVIRRPRKLAVAPLILIALLLPHWFHNLLRERWVWLFFIFFIYFAIRDADGLTDGGKSSLNK